MGLFLLPFSRVMLQGLRDSEARSVAFMPSAAQHGFSSAYQPSPLCPLSCPVLASPSTLTPAYPTSPVRCLCMYSVSGVPVLPPPLGLPLWCICFRPCPSVCLWYSCWFDLFKYCMLQSESPQPSLLPQREAELNLPFLSLFISLPSPLSSSPPPLFFFLWFLEMNPAHWTWHGTCSITKLYLSPAGTF